MAKHSKRKPGSALPDSSHKREGVTSSFSAATGNVGRYGGEDTADVKHTTGNDNDKIAAKTRNKPPQQKPTN